MTYEEDQAYRKRQELEEVQTREQKYRRRYYASRSSERSKEASAQVQLVFYREHYNNLTNLVSSLDKQIYLLSEIRSLEGRVTRESSHSSGANLGLVLGVMIGLGLGIVVGSVFF